MNNWDKIWKKRTAEIDHAGTVFETFKELKRADGFDTQDVDGYYEAFYRQWEVMAERIAAGCNERVEASMRLGAEVV